MSLITALVAVLVLGGAVALMAKQEQDENADAAQDRLYVDTASQFVVNMFSYTQDSIDASVDRFVNSTSGPLAPARHDEPGPKRRKPETALPGHQCQHRGGDQGAALEKVDDLAKRADVLVALRVAVTDLDGNNAPSKPYRLRVTVAEDDNGHMSFYDLKYPNGGN